MELKNVVPWGRTFDEYAAMFALSDDDLRKNILGCGDGPAGFNAAMHTAERRAVSCDPLYAFTGAQIAARIEEAQHEVMAQVRKNRDDYAWDRIRTPEELLAKRMAAMRAFLDDYGRGKAEGRYVAASVTALPFADGAFDIALSSHFLFLYDGLGLEFHLLALREMLRVAKEARLFPLKGIRSNETARFLAPVTRSLEQDGCRVEKIAVGYEFQKGANEMLRISRR